MYNPNLSVPARRISGWVAETDPKYARAWLGALPLANNAEAAREIYQALYTVNRLELRAPVRLELMRLYDEAVANVATGLQAHLLHAVPPLGPKKRQLAEFIRRLHVEMAYGYKCCLRDLARARLALRRKSRSAPCIERSLFHLDEVLLRSYSVYLPHPAAIWREMHELYRYAERLGVIDEVINAHAHGAVRPVTIGERYVQALLLGLINPYQLPQNMVHHVHAFLAQWGSQARILAATQHRELADLNACFLIDPATDLPAVPLARNNQEHGADTRALDARALLDSIHQFTVRLEQGEPIERLGLGIDCLDSACADLLKRMGRAWGETARRRYARRQRSSSVFICIGLPALHFFLSGQRPFSTFLGACPDSDAPHAPALGDTAFVELDESETTMERAPTRKAEATPGAERYRVDRWRLRDIGPQGMSVARYGDAAAPIRVGELIGVQQPRDFGRWRPGVIRWVKTPETSSVKAGMELLAAEVTPVALRFVDKRADGLTALPGLRLSATAVMQRPSTLLLPRGSCQVGDEFDLVEEEAEPRRIRLLRLIERTGSFEQMVYGDIVTRVLRRR